MIDLIKRSDLLRILKNNEPMNWRDTDEEITERACWHWFNRIVEEADAVDTVAVVRCCRCRFAVNKREHGEMVTYCALDWGMRGVLDPNDYCSYGKEIKRCQD